METLQIFIACRGLPTKIFSDNARNFVGVNNFFKKCKSKISDIAVAEHFEWSFIPPRAPYFGGIWKSAVHSTKIHLQAVIRDTVLSFVEYSTLIAKIEAVLNSRLIVYKSHSEQRAEPLTPAYFLIGQSLLTSLMLDSVPLSWSNRLQLLQNLLKGFSSRWSKDYLNRPQQRHK